MGFGVIFWEAIVSFFSIIDLLASFFEISGISDIEFKLFIEILN